MPDEKLSPELVLSYLVQALTRAGTVFTTRPLSDPAHVLALGEAVALFNLADELGLIDEVRRQVDRQAGRDVYRSLSEAMKTYYLGSAGGGGQPAASRRTGQRPAEPRPAPGRRQERTAGPPRGAARRPGPPGRGQRDQRGGREE